MEIQRSFLVTVAALILSTMCAGPTCAQTPSTTYQGMTREERSAFVSSSARRIAKEISGRDYAFTAAFEEDIQQSLNQYVRRIGNNSEKRELLFVIERGQAQAPVLSSAFRARGLSGLIGLYIPWIESEYVNLESPNAMGSVGMFQFLPSTGAKYGLSATDLLDVNKSADAAARYILDSVEVFKHEPMKEALALLAYNRGGDRTMRDLKMVRTDRNNDCSICALSAERSKLDDTFRRESVFYVPLFFAAAIIGENPQVFGLQSRPLSTY